MQQHGDPAAFVAALPGADQTLTGYLVDEVLDAQPPDVRAFLLDTCVVDRLCPALADALTGRADGETVLARLQSGNVLTTAVDEAPGWYRYNPLLTRVLLAELERERPGSAGELHRRASAWFDGAGLLVDAVRHAAAVPDWHMATATVVRRLGIGPLLAGREATRLEAALAGLPGSAEGAMPAVVRAARALTTFDLSVCREQVALAEERAGEEVEADRPSLLASVAVIRAILARVDGDLAAARSALSAGEAQLSRVPDAADHPELLALLLSSVGTVELWTGRFDEAERTLRRGLGASGGEGCQYPRLNVLGRLAVLEFLRGRLGRAAELAREEVALADDSGLPVTRRTGAGHLALALVAAEQGDPATARRHLDDATRSVGARHDPLVAAMVPMLQALRYVDGRDFRRALSSLAAVRDRPLPSWLADRLALTSALVHIGRRDTAAAAAAIDAMNSPDAAGAVVRAVLALALGDRWRATELIAPVLTGDTADGAGSRIEAWLVAARVHLLAGARPLACEALGRALVLAEPEHRRRPFLRAGPLGRDLLAAFPDVGGAHPWLGAAPVSGSGARRRREGPRAEADDATFERLTGRETAVLGRMARAMSVEDIADDLFLSVNTVKTHQRSIYRKLTVSRRNDAVRRARSLGLV